MKRITIFIIIISAFGIVICKGQSRNSYWCFGDSAGIYFGNSGNPITFSTSLDTRGSCVSIADTSGNLLFYANTRATIPGNTTLVWNTLNNMMTGGDNIVGSGWYKELVIVPYPGNDSIFYLFSAGSTGTTGFFYSVINMSQIGGLGKVVQKNIQLQGSSFWANDGIAAVKHGNGRDWWVIVRDWNNFNNLFYFYLVSPAGVVLHHTQNIGDIVQSSLFRIEPSEDGNKVACVTNKGLLSIYDFDRCTGYLSNELALEHETTNPNLVPWYPDCELANNNQILYVSSLYTQNDSNSYLFQYNLNDANPSLTRDTLFSIKQPIVGGLLELAPDSKIYWACNYDVPGIFPYPYPDTARNVYNENLSVINSPDSLGTACDFQPFSFYLGGKRTYYGLPNNPNYELKADSGSICDTLTVGIPNIEQGILNAELFVFFHPDWQTTFLNAKGLKGKQFQLTVVDALGHVVFQQNGKLNSPYYTYDLHLQGVAGGLYIVSLVTEKEVLSGKFVKE